MNRKITILGSGTCQIQANRMASSVLVELDGLKVVYDFGRGICLRLSELSLKHNDINHIILSHFHPDHISDLIPFLHAAAWSKIEPRQSDLNIYGPPGLKSMMMKVVTLFQQGELTSNRFKLKMHEISDSEFSIGTQKFFFAELPPVNNHGLKFKVGENIYAFTGDSNFHQQEIAFLEGVDLAVIDSGHITDGEIVELAVSTKAKSIICSHLYRDLDIDELNRLARRKGCKGRILMAKDLMCFNIGGL